LRVPDLKKFPKSDLKRLLKQAYDLSVEKLKGREVTPNGVTVVKSISEKKKAAWNAKKGSCGEKRAPSNA